MSTENKLANKKEEARKLPLGFYRYKLCYCRTSICNISFIVTRVLELLAGNSLALCQKMTEGEFFLLLLEHSVWFW
jgi:hypothetical protein